MRLHLSSGLSLAVTAACLITIRPVQGDTFYVSSVNGNEVYQISSAGTVTPLAAINLLPEGLAIDPRGRLYIANDGANSINRIGVGGAVTTFATNVNQPYGLAFDSKTNLFAACFNLNRILRISTTGTVSNFASVQGPYGLAVDVGDNVYAASTVASRILRITPGGAASVFGPYVSSPQGLAFDPFGNLYVASYSGTITRITPAGAGSTYASGLNSLVGVVFDNSGNLYAASYITGTIYRIAPDQTVTTFATIPGNPSFIAVNPVPSFRPGLIGLAATGGNLVLTWEGPFTLQSTPELQSPYLDETNATSPWTNTLSAAGSRFFRLRK